MLSSQNIDPNDPNSQRFVLIRLAVIAWRWFWPQSVAHADRESDTKRILRASVLVSAFLSLIVCVTIFLKPAKDTIKAYQADGYLKEAHKAMDRKDLPTAVAFAQKAFHAAPDHEPTVRLNAELLTEAGSAYAMHYWRKLDEQGVTSLDDRIGRVKALLRIGQAKDARVQWEALVKEHPQNKELMKMADEMWGSQRTTGIALDALKKVTAGDVADLDSAFKLATLQLKTGQPAEVSAGWSKLLNLAKGKDAIALQALRFVHDRDKATAQGTTKLDVHERGEIANLLDAHPDATGWDHTAALDLRVQLDSRERDKLIAKCIERFFTGKPPAESEPIVRWLVLNNEPTRAIALVDLKAVKNLKDCQGLMLNYLTALTRLRRVTDLETVIMDKEIILANGTRSYHIAVLAFLKSEPKDEVGNKFRTAIRYAADEGQWTLLLSMGEFCLKQQLFTVGVEAFRSVAGTGNPRLAPYAYDGWMRCCRAIGDTMQLFDAVRTANQFWPDNRNFQEHLLYLKLLLGSETEVSLGRAHALLEIAELDAVRKVITALGEYRLGDLASAVNTCQNLVLDDLLKDHAEKIAFFAALYFDAGADMVAGGDGPTFVARLELILNSIPADRPLLPEERHMVDRVRAGVQQLKSQHAGR